MYRQFQVRRKILYIHEYYLLSSCSTVVKFDLKSKMAKTSPTYLNQNFIPVIDYIFLAEMIQSKS